MCASLRDLKLRHRALVSSGITSDVPSEIVDAITDLIGQNGRLIDAIKELVNIPEASLKNLYYKSPFLKSDKELYSSAAFRALEVLQECDAVHSALAAELHKHGQFEKSKSEPFTHAGPSPSTCGDTSRGKVVFPAGVEARTDVDVDAITAYSSPDGV
jgi:hypothetical protein